MVSNVDSALLFDLLGDADGSGVLISDIHKNMYTPAYGLTFSAGTDLEQEQMQQFLLLGEETHSVGSPFAVPSSHKSPLPQGFVFPLDSKASDSLQWMNDGTASQDGIDDLLALPQETSGSDISPEADSGPRMSTPIPEPALPRRRPRKQNHACDQCRLAKRACNFRNEVVPNRQRPQIPCTTCTSRNLECTVVWLETKKAALQLAKQRVKKTTTEATTEDSREMREAAMEDWRSPKPTPDTQIVRQFSARETCMKHFNLYVDVLDMPLSNCLLQGLMPRRYSLGVAALHPLSKNNSFSRFSQRADRWVSNCLDAEPEARASFAVEPLLFRAASVLDSVFERGSTEHDPHPFTTRDESINATYKWAALATAAQFSVNPAGDKDHSRDVAYAIWQQARQKVFDNIAATTSFRHALALVLFGVVEPPREGEQSPELQEASRYALCEGVKRLHVLCRRARSCLSNHQGSGRSRCSWHKTNTNGDSHPAHSLPPDARENLLELIAAVEWLFGLVNAAKIVLSGGKIQPLGDEFDQSSVGFSSQRYETTQMLSLELPEAQSGVDWGSEPTMQQWEVDNNAGAVTTLWRNDAPDSTIMQKTRRSGIIVILFWNALAHLTTASESMLSGDCDLEEIHQLYTSINSIIKLWRATFGTFDEMSTLAFQQAQPETRRMTALFSNDGELAVLLFFDMVQTLAGKLSSQPPSRAKQALQQELQSTRGFLAEQRLISATQVATFAYSCRGASPGIHGVHGLKAQLQDLGAHPVPAMVVLAHQRAATALSEEVHSLVGRMESGKASKMTANLNICLGALQILQDSLVTFPDFSR